MRVTAKIERWFPVPDDPDGAEVLVAHVSMGELARINEEVSRSETRYQTTPDGDLVPEVVVSADAGEAGRRVLCAAVRDWKNIFDEAGKPLACTDANKMTARTRIDGFAEFVRSCRERLATDVAAEKGHLEKN